MRKTENTDLTTREPETTFVEMMVAIRDNVRGSPLTAIMVLAIVI